MGTRWARVIPGCCLFGVLAAAAPDGVSLDVTIRSMVDSSPIRSAEVTVERVDKPDPAKKFEPEDSDEGVITRAAPNGQGVVVLRELPPVPMRIRINADGYASTELTPLDATARSHHFDVYLPRAVELTGIVRDAHSKPVANVSVTIPTVLASNGRHFVVSPPLAAKTDAEGRFRLKGAPEGIGQFALSDGTRDIPLLQPAHRLDTQPVELTIAPTGLLSVTIDAPDHRRGQYIIKVQKRLALQGSRVKQERNAVDRGSTTFVDLPAGEYRVTASIARAPEHVQPLTALIEIKAGHKAELTLKPKE
jgi:hypothetical protein